MMEMEVISLKQKNNEQARKLFYLENVSSTAFNRFSLTDAKFASASDKVFFVYNNLFYILTNSDISSQNPNSQVESRAVLSKSLDAYCPPNSHQVVVYGKEKIFDKTTNDRIEKPYIAVYDHTTDLIKCKFSHESNSKNPLYIKARASTIYNTINNNAADQMLSFISLVYSQEIFIYYGPFTNRKIDNPLKIDLNNHKIVLADFGKQIDIEGQLINTFLVVSSENGENKSKLTIWHLTKQNRITENA
ncbi:hypothetical protein TRFO_06817 [Tritrichomonas foetus]|uniref:Uncharacterized protein n=1 Tax=Tritrichomonas foetus TaxID=1144522 RepID=A0A1J4JXG1_9EUKA|nr:hypothetical protein TRFO_06817 [Tritrichomonas foetus]|eukprot:OHT03152.1 hypothetical protein TRFO_06817 [Tritrichomonas foetus]